MKLKTATLFALKFISLFAVLMMSQCGTENDWEEIEDHDIFSICLNNLIEQGHIENRKSNEQFELTIIHELIANKGIGKPIITFDDELLRLISNDSTWLIFFSEIEMSKVLDSQSKIVSYIDVAKLTVDNCKVLEWSKARMIKEKQSDLDDFWAKYYSEFPRSIGIVSFTTILYSKERDKAMVCVDYFGGRINGEGVRILLEKNKYWTVREITELWES